MKRKKKEKKEIRFEMTDRYKVEKKYWKNRLENQIVSDRHDVKARLFQKFFSFSFCFFFFSLLSGKLLK